MSDRYSGTIKCPHCSKLTEYLFNEEWGSEQDCDKCGKQFTMRIELIARKK